MALDLGQVVIRPKYIVVEDPILEDLVKTVNEMMEKQYVPIGGVSYCPENDEESEGYVQAMVLK